jgi:hypothetical protein
MNLFSFICKECGLYDAGVNYKDLYKSLKLKDQSWTKTRIYKALPVLEKNEYIEIQRFSGTFTLNESIIYIHDRIFSDFQFRYFLRDEILVDSEIKKNKIQFTIFLYILLNTREILI